MRNSLNIPAGDYDSLLVHEKMARNSAKGQGLSALQGEAAKDATKLIDGGMYQ